MRSRLGQSGPTKRIVLYSFFITLFTAYSNFSFSLSLEDVYQLALSEDPKLKSALSIQKADAEKLKQRQAQFLPQIDFNISKGLRRHSTDLGYDTAYDNYGVSMEMPMIDGESRQKIKAEEVSVEKSAIQFSLEKQALIERVILAYIALLEVKVKLNIATEISQAALRRVEQAQEHFDEGLATSSALSEGRAAYDLAHAREIMAEGDVQSSWEGLYRLTGLDDPVGINPLDLHYPVLALQPANPSSWVDKALETNFILRLAQFDVEIAEMRLMSMKARYEPTLYFSASVENINDDVRVSEEVRRGTVTLTFNLPLYEGGSTDSAILEYHHRRDAAMDLYDDARREIKQQVRTLVRRLNNSAVVVLALKQSLKSAKAAQGESEANYRVGMRGIEEVLSVERRLHETKRDYALSRYEYVRNQVSLKGLLGELSGEYIASLNSWLSSD